jgi:serine/threonine protein kinase
MDNIPITLARYLPGKHLTSETGEGWVDTVLCEGKVVPGLVVKYSRRDRGDIARESTILKAVHDHLQSSQCEYSLPDHGEVRDYFVKWKAYDNRHLYMEYIQGVSLDVHLGNIRETSSKSEWLGAMKPLFLQIAKALKHLDAMSITHRDLKPQNILVAKNTTTTTTTIKILDFGYASRQGDPKIDASNGKYWSDHPQDQTSQTRHHAPSQDLFGLGKIIQDAWLRKEDRPTCFETLVTQTTRVDWEKRWKIDKVIEELSKEHSTCCCIIM